MDMNMNINMYFNAELFCNKFYYDYDENPSNLKLLLNDSQITLFNDHMYGYQNFVNYMNSQNITTFKHTEWNYVCHLLENNNKLLYIYGKLYINNNKYIMFNYSEVIYLQYNIVNNNYIIKNYIFSLNKPV